MNKNNLPVIIIFSCLFIYLISGFNIDFKIYDEGIAVVGAVRITDGESPYRDFWSIYPPGQYYLLSVLFKIFGFELITERIFSIIVFFLSAIIIYRVSFNLTKSVISIISPVIYVFFISYSTMYGTAMGTSILMALISFYYFHKWLSSDSSKFLFASAFFAGLTTIFRLDIGSYTLFANLLILIIHQTKSKFEIKKSLKNLLTIISGFSLVFIPVYLTIIISSGLENVVEQLIIFPSKVFPDYRSLPFPNPLNIFSDSYKITTRLNNFWQGNVFYIPIIIYFSAIIIIFKNKNEENTHIERLKVLHIVIAGLLFYLQASIRSDIEHLLPTLIVSTVIIVYIAFKFGKKAIIKISLASLTLLLLSVPIYKKIEQNSQKLELSKMPRLNGILISPMRYIELKTISDFFNENVHSDEKIYIGNTRHDLLYINDVMMYFILNRKAGTRYHELSPGQVTKKDAQIQIIRDLQNNGVKFVILRKEEIQTSEKNLSSISSGITILDDYLDINYRNIFATPNYIVKKLLDKPIQNY